MSEPDHHQKVDYRRTIRMQDRMSRSIAFFEPLNTPHSLPLPTTEPKSPDYIASEIRDYNLVLVDHNLMRMGSFLAGMDPWWEITGEVVGRHGDFTGLVSSEKTFRGEWDMDYTSRAVLPSSAQMNPTEPEPEWVREERGLTQAPIRPEASGRRSIKFNPTPPVTTVSSTSNSPDRPESRRTKSLPADHEFEYTISLKVLYGQSFSSPWASPSPSYRKDRARRGGFWTHGCLVSQLG